MRKPINYILGEAVEGKWKQELLVSLGRQFNLKTLIETGTCDGGTLFPIHRAFDKCYSIELSEHYYNYSKNKFKDAANVRLFHGNSSVKLKEILEMIGKGPFIFWLDAHPSGGLTASEGDPLPEEIKAIIGLSPDSLMVIDDQKDNILCQVPKEYYEGYTVEFHYGVVILYKTGLYKIPDFV